MLAIFFICVSIINSVISSYTDIDLNGFITGSEGYKAFGAVASARLGSKTMSVGTSTETEQMI